MRLVYRDRQCSSMYFFLLCVSFLAINLRDRAIIYNNMPLFFNTQLADDVSPKVVHNKSRGKGSAWNYHPTPTPLHPGAKEHCNMSIFSLVSCICIPQNRIPQLHRCNIWETYSGKQNASSVYSLRFITVLRLHCYCLTVLCEIISNPSILRNDTRQNSAASECVQLLKLRLSESLRD